MGIKTKAEYLESLKTLRSEIYVLGKKLEDNAAESPYFRTNINVVGLGYDLANDPRWKDDFTMYSPLVDDTVSWWTHVPQSVEDLVRIVRNIKKITGTKYCVFCMAIALDVIWAVTHEMDQENGTEYHQRVRKFFRHIQNEDLRFSMAVMDAKGDRGLRPADQPDPDLHLRVVDRNEKGIVVRGCKAQVSAGPITHMMVVFPCRTYREDEKDYAVSFAVPTDTKGIVHMIRPAAGPLQPREIANPVSSEVGFVEGFTVFNDVFIPWENVFMCGEWDFTERLLGYFSSYVRMAKGVCCSGRTELFIGAGALAARYNGIERAGHVRSKLTDMMISSHCGYGCALAAAVESRQHPSGIMIPDISLANAGLHETRIGLQQYFGTLMELAGGAVTTMPLEPDYRNPETRGYMEKYLKGKADLPAEERIRALNLVQDITASPFTGYFMSSILCAGGTPETNRLEVFRNYDLEKQVKVARAMAKIQGSILDQDGS